MLSRLGDKLSSFAQKVIPDPFIIALILTAIVFLGAWGLTPYSLGETLGFWRDGFWDLLAFSMQMCLILVSGYALATSKPIEAAIDRLARQIRSPRMAVYVVALIAVITGLIHWGLGLIVGAMLARTIGEITYKNKIRVHYPLLGAAGYLGLLVWHGGFSGSAPLSIATDNHFLVKTIGIIPVSKTLLSHLNLVATTLSLIFIPLIAAFCHPSDKKSVKTINEFVDLIDDASSKGKLKSRKKGMENSSFLSLIVAVIGIGLSIHYFSQKGIQGVNLNSMIWLFLFFAILFQGTLRKFLKSITQSAGACAGIILQFPFYSGIMGVMKSTGLILAISQFFQSIATAKTLPLFVLTSAGLVNLFVPSGGGQWAIQGPIIIEAAKQLGSDINTNIMALAYGDQLTNMLQPFWALALLGITKLKARDIIGYGAILMIFAFLIYSASLLFIH